MDQRIGLSDPPENNQISQMSLDELKEKLYELDKLEPEIKRYFAQKHELLERFKILTGPGFEFEADESFGTGHHWQTPDGLVWCTVKVKGKYVSFTDIDIERTRDASRGEKKGLSMTKARKFGYTVEGK